jgi:hypothetical protein
MALPSNKIVEEITPSPFLFPDDLAYTEIVRYELGGVSIGDGSQGLQKDAWSSRYDSSTGGIYLKNMRTEIETLVITVANVIRLSFSFDSNMRPVIAYSTGEGDSFFYWYDSTIANYNTTQLPSDSIDLVVTHDDKRRIGQQANYSDVLIFYLRNDRLYYRQQRDRYTVERQIATLSEGSHLKHAGMCRDLRIRFEIENGQFISSP